MPPLPGALWAIDTMTGYQMGFALLAALRHRDRTGEGQKVHVSMLSVAMDCQCQELVTAFNLGIRPQRSTRPFAHAWVTAPYGSYRAKDGWIVISQVPLHLLGEALDDNRLRSLTKWSDGMTHRDEVYDIVSAIVPRKTVQEWIEIMARYKLWCGKVYNYDDLAHDPHVLEAGLIATVEHPTAGTLKMPNVPAQFSRTPATVRTAPPLLGQHTECVLREVAGLSENSLDDLRRSGALGLAVAPLPTS
jgi:crotonobetainyl-CoA:carnitine CoA-transferase CaiB-like acyl-CoA transferase